MNRLSRSLLLCFFLLGLQAAHAQTVSAAEMEKRRVLAVRLMAQTGFDKMYDTMADQMIPLFEPMLTQMLKSTNAPEPLKKEFISKFSANFLREFKSTETKQLYTDVVTGILAKDYSIEEMEALSAFYATPLAQKMLARQPQQMQGILLQGRAIGEASGRRAAAQTLEQMGIGKR